MSDPTNEDNLRSIRAKAYAVFRKAGCTIETSYAGMIRGWKNWTRGVSVVYSRDRTYVTSHYDIRSEHAGDIARAVTALRAAGWTVNDDGGIVALPEAK